MLFSDERFVLVGLSDLGDGAAPDDSLLTLFFVSLEGSGCTWLFVADFSEEESQADNENNRTADKMKKLKSFNSITPFTLSILAKEDNSVKVLY
ncbi:hypothetical protein GCM10007096_24030 [Pullulanibacillus pueri]|uniref:Uncharacterized protein n=1 Tax=Pullulanibacillus pueri TaxID=1437324 RepID=A0A8J3EMH8_9BACL|nr:hypothetical protein GCM10007096_24030 [Pullulanibacillus pueri]